jgi:hypothetical protein
MKNYIAHCPLCGKVTAIHVADTVAEQLSAAPSVRKWIKRGDTVELEEHADNAPMPEWCQCHRLVQRTQNDQTG